MMERSSNTDLHFDTTLGCSIDKTTAARIRIRQSTADTSQQPPGNTVHSAGDLSLQQATSDGDLIGDDDWSDGWDNTWRGTSFETLCEDKPDEEEAAFTTPSTEAIASLLKSLGQESTSIDTSSPPPIPSQAKNKPTNKPPVASKITVASLDPELRDAFLDDASSCLALMEAAVLQLESDPKHSESLNQICRQLHTLKGAAGSVGLTELAGQLHALEDNLQDDQAANRPCDFNSLLRSIDLVRKQITGDHLTDDSAQPTESSNSFDDGPADDESVRVKSSQLNRLMDMLAELVMLRNRRETELSDLQEVYHELIGSVSKLRLLSHEGNEQTLASSSLQISEVANDVLEIAHSVRACARPVAEGNQAVSDFIRQFRKELVELRRSPVSGLFRRLQRVVRDAAQAETKDVQLMQIGEDAGIERSLQQRLYEPLLHIVRNCVCHGIETAEQRSRSGKHPVGTITLEAHSGPDLFVIEIRDDGRGLDYEAIRRRGIESGLISPNQTTSREELAQLIFHPGFSTRTTTNQVAGRGVGMDVVASTLQRMRGWLDIDSRPNQGTQIRLSFPIPSVIQHAMVFRSAGQLFALPMQSVHRAGEINPDTLKLLFAELLDCDQHASCKSQQGIVLACDTRLSSGASANAPTTSNRVTLLVDEIVGPEEVVVRPLPAILKHHPYCTGATLSGMGQTVLFLDARRIVESQRQRLSSNAVDSNQQEQESTRKSTGPAELGRPRVLVVDDSISARKRVVRSLHRYAVDITEASDGREALQILKTQKFAAVFSDLEMPHVNGLELLSEIRSRDRSDAPPVVIISSRNEDEFTQRAKQLGVHDYLIKPLADDAFDNAIRGMERLQNLRPISMEPLPLNGELQ